MRVGSRMSQRSYLYTLIFLLSWRYLFEQSQATHAMTILGSPFCTHQRTANIPTPVCRLLKRPTTSSLPFSHLTQGPSGVRFPRCRRINSRGNQSQCLSFSAEAQWKARGARPHPSPAQRFSFSDSVRGRLPEGESDASPWIGRSERAQNLGAPSPPQLPPCFQDFLTELLRCTTRSTSSDRMVEVPWQSVMARNRRCQKTGILGRSRQG